MAAVIVLLLIAVIVLIIVVICLYRSYTKYSAAVLVLGLVLGLGWCLSTEMKYLALALALSWGVVQKRHVGAPAPRPPSFPSPPFPLFPLRRRYPFCG